MYNKNLKKGNLYRFSSSRLFVIRQFYSFRSINFRSIVFVREKYTSTLSSTRCDRPHLNRWRKWCVQAIISVCRWWTKKITILRTHSIVSSNLTLHFRCTQTHWNNFKTWKRSILRFHVSTSRRHQNLLCLHQIAIRNNIQRWVFTNCVVCILLLPTRQPVTPPTIPESEIYDSILLNLFNCSME